MLCDVYKIMENKNREKNLSKIFQINRKKIDTHQAKKICLIFYKKIFENF